MLTGGTEDRVAQLRPKAVRLAGVLSWLSAAEVGERNDRLNEAAGLAAGLLARVPEADRVDELAPEVWRQAVADAGVMLGLDRREAERTTASGWGYGWEHPAEDRPPDNGHERQVRERLEWLRVRHEADALYAAEVAEASPLPSAGELLRSGGSLILDTAPEPVPVWGPGERVVLADGEALVIVGGPGLGKTTLGQQLALGRCGLPGHADLLGCP